MYGMRRKCDDERLSRWTKGVTAAVLAAGVAGYGGWAARQADERMRTEGETWVARAEALAEATSRMGVDLGGVSRDLAPEAWAEEGKNADWHVSHCAEGRRKEAQELKDAWTEARRREREAAKAVADELGSGRLEGMQGQWDELREALERSKERLERASGGAWVVPWTHRAARAGLETALAPAERVAALRDAWAGRAAEREGLYGKLRAVPPEGGRAGVEREGEALSRRAGALLEDGARMASDLEAMSRGADPQEATDAKWYAEHCEERRRGEARAMRTAWAAAGKEEDVLARKVAEGLGGGDARETAREWERLLEAVKEEKRALDEAREGLWEHPAKYGEAKAGLEAALEKPSALWEDHGRWAEARARREAEYAGLSRLPRKGGTVQATLGALMRSGQEARAAWQAAEREARRLQAELGTALTRAKAQYDQDAELLRRLHAINAGEVGTVESSGMGQIGRELAALKNEEEKRAGEWREFAEKQKAALAELGRAAQRHRSALDGLGANDSAEKVERACLEASATAKGCKDFAADIEERLDWERSSNERAAKAIDGFLREAEQILKGEQGHVPEASAATVNAERRKLRGAMALLAKRGRRAQDALENGPWEWAFEEERQQRWKEFEKSLQMAESAVPEDMPDGPASANALRNEQGRTWVAKRMEKEASELLDTLEKRMEEARTLEGLLERLGGLWAVLDEVDARRGGTAVAEALAGELDVLEQDMARWLEEEWTKSLQAGALTGRTEKSATRLQELERKIRKAAGRPQR